METPKVESKPNKAYLFFLVFGFIFTDIILYNMIADTSKSPYPDLMEVILILVIFGFGLGMLRALWIYFPHLKIYTDRLEISYWGGVHQRVIRFSDISSIHTRHENNEWMSWASDVWIIYTNDNKKYKIEEGSYTNYKEIIKGFEKHKVRVDAPVKPSNPKNELARFLVTGAFFFICILSGAGFSYYQSTHYTLERDDFIEVKCTLAKGPEIRKGKNTSSLYFPVREYPGFNFGVSEGGYRTTDRSDFMRSLETGDKVYFLLDKEEYRQKLTKETPLSFWNKYFKYPGIGLHGVRSEKMTYLTLEGEIRDAKDGYRWTAWLLSGLAIYILYVGRKEIMDIMKKIKYLS